MALDKMYGVFGHDVLCGKAAFRAAVLRLIKVQRSKGLTTGDRDMAKNREVKMTDRERKIKAIAKRIVNRKEIKLVMAGFDGEVTELDAARVMALDIVKLLDEPADEPCRHLFTMGIGIEESIKNRCVKCGELIDAKKPFSWESEVAKEKIEAAKKCWLEDARKCLINLRSVTLGFNSNPHYQWVEEACDYIEAMIAELNKEKDDDGLDGRQNRELKEESIALEIFDAYQRYQMERDSSVIGISWNDVPPNSKKVWIACAKPVCAHIEAAEEANRFGGEMLTKLHNRIKKLEAELKSKRK